MPSRQRRPHARSLTSAVLALAAASLARPAQAQMYEPNYPVCLQVYQGSGGTDFYMECTYTSLPQCQATASGRAAQCVVNPFYGKGKTAPRKPRAN